MPKWYCRRCNNEQAYDRTNNEFYHECNSGTAAMDKITLLNLDPGNWNMQGQPNQLQGQIAATLGYKTSELDERGYNKDTTKTIPTVIPVIATIPKKIDNTIRHPF